jgi:hypothetical protein
VDSKQKKLDYKNAKHSAYQHAKIVGLWTREDVLVRRENGVSWIERPVDVKDEHGKRGQKCPYDKKHSIRNNLVMRHWRTMPRKMPLQVVPQFHGRLKAPEYLSFSWPQGQCRRSGFGYLNEFWQI